MLKSIIFICFWGAVLSAELDCYEHEIYYSGTTINNGLEQHTDFAAECQILCQMTNGCLYFSWFDSNYPESSYRSTCWLRSDLTGRTSNNNAVSGPRMCSPDKPTTLPPTTSRPGPGSDCLSEVNTNTQGRIDSTTIDNIPSMEECSVRCKLSDSCNFWTWHHKNAGPWAFRCVLMRDYENTASDINTISGEKNCSPGPDPSDDCHDYVYVGNDSNDFFYTMGYMKKQSGKSSYQQIGGGHILQYKAGQGWLVTVSLDGDILAYTEDSARCAYEATSTWWYLDQGEWKADDKLHARISPEEQCNQDASCAGCNLYINWDGHDWCCSNECDYGWIDPAGGCACGH